MPQNRNKCHHCATPHFGRAGFPIWTELWHEYGQMDRPAPRKRAPRPLDAPRLEELALAYVARFAVTRAKLEAYLQRKLRERGWDGEAAPDPAGLADRFVALGYVDDAAWARMKSGSLMRRGLGQRRVGQALAAAGVAGDIREDLRPSPAEGREAALLLARRRRFGPFGASLPDRPVREKQLAAMLRAGHPLDSARELVNAPSIAAAEAWARMED